MQTNSLCIQLIVKVLFLTYPSYKKIWHLCHKKVFLLVFFLKLKKKKTLKSKTYFLQTFYNKKEFEKYFKKKKKMSNFFKNFQSMKEKITNFFFFEQVKFGIKKILLLTIPFFFLFFL